MSVENKARALMSKSHSKQKQSTKSLTVLGKGALIRDTLSADLGIFFKSNNTSVGVSGGVRLDRGKVESARVEIRATHEW